MYGFLTLPPVVGRYFSILFGVCSNCGFSSCGMTGFSVTFGYFGTCGCGASGCLSFCYVSGVGGGGFF